MKKIRVMIVEDSPTVREMLIHIISQDPHLEVAGIAETGERALEIIGRVKPDVISMDIRMPGINGLDVTKRIMQTQPTPIVVVSASVEKEDLNISMNALRAGALAVVEKPVSANHTAYALMAKKICTQLAIMSEVRVISQRARRKSVLKQKAAASAPSVSRFKDHMTCGGRFSWLGLVASTGGPKALSDILKDLPADFPIPIFIVQHITDSFRDGFARWLATTTPLSVVIVEDRMSVEPGKIYLPPADHHLLVQNGHVLPDHGPYMCRQRPSGTVLFQSMADQRNDRGLGVLLTGMGNDGAEGLRAIREAGGHTIVEDESTAVVFGMPGAAIALEAACEKIPLNKIADRILDLVGFNNKGLTSHANR